VPNRSPQTKTDIGATPFVSIAVSWLAKLGPPAGRQLPRRCSGKRRGAAWVVEIELYPELFPVSRIQFRVAGGGGRTSDEGKRNRRIAEMPQCRFRRVTGPPEMAAKRCYTRSRQLECRIAAAPRSSYTEEVGGRWRRGALDGAGREAVGQNAEKRQPPSPHQIPKFLGLIRSSHRRNNKLFGRSRLGTAFDGRPPAQARRRRSDRLMKISRQWCRRVVECFLDPSRDFAIGKRSMDLMTEGEPSFSSSATGALRNVKAGADAEAPRTNRTSKRRAPRVGQVRAKPQVFRRRHGPRPASRSQ